ncbi:unnamed protein product [Schistosoma margrebowiei]|uniref:Uncharacterized protein n=1 Tax=Schistosoma margrebowiei TaxID=48269 RepID=A0A183LEM3_9TREM|nr:unnamed protein product [Schistosoma margrebowiei]
MEHGTLESFAAFPFESYMRKIMRSVHCGFAAAKQAAQRYAEEVYFQSILNQDMTDNVTEPELTDDSSKQMHQSGKYILVDDKENNKVVCIPKKWLLNNDHYLYRDDISEHEIVEGIDVDSRFNVRKCAVMHRCAGQKRLAKGEMLLYSGHEENNAPHTQGVALMLSKLARNALVGWESHGSRIIKASFKTKKEGILMNVIQCYAPTNDSNDDIKDQFYERLQSIVEKCPRKDLTILMGDLNAKVGIDNTGYVDIMGRHGLGERNENEERFANLCAFNKLVIGGTIFPHKRIHKATWISPDHTTENQIDHICINKKFRRTMEDVRIRRCADLASGHHLVVANLNLKLKKNWKTGQTALQRLNIAFFEILTKSTNSR